MKSRAGLRCLGVGLRGFGAGLRGFSVRFVTGSAPLRPGALGFEDLGLEGVRVREFGFGRIGRGQAPKF